MKGHWPTLRFDFLATLPFILLSVPFVFTGVSSDRGWQWRVCSMQWSWERQDYLTPTIRQPFLLSIFVFWSLEICVNLGMVLWHFRVHHHPKFYATRANHLAIRAHIVGGCLAQFGTYIAFLSGNALILASALAGGVFLHAPSAYWQARNLHGGREVMQPGYFFVITMLLVKYVDVLTQGATPESLFSVGIGLSIFGLIRLFHGVLELVHSLKSQLYDRAAVLATTVSLPFCLGIWGSLMFVVTILIWNTLIECWCPQMRPLLVKEHAFRQVLPAMMHGKVVDLEGEVKVALAAGVPKAKVVRQAIFDVITDRRGYCMVQDLVVLLDHWGIPESEDAAAYLFKDSDEKGDHKVTFDEFSHTLHFVFERIEDVGEVHLETDGQAEDTKLLDMTVIVSDVAAAT